MENIFIGRQPILDRNGRLFGYELLHRARRESRCAHDDRSDGDQRTADLLLKAVWEIGIPRISGAHRSFINMTRNLLMNPAFDALPSGGIVLEVLEDVPVDPALLERVSMLRARGFEIALDDFVYSPDKDALVMLAHIVKIDVLALDAAELERNVRLLQPRGVRLLAEKVEDAATYERALALGFDYFQGYHFARPHVHQETRIRPNKLFVLELLARVNDPDIGPKELADIIRNDVALSITILRWANGSIYGSRHTIESVERAIVLLGLQTIRSWAALLALARMGASPSELLKMLLVRARTCELLASAAQRDNPSNYFTVGLLSALDVLLQVSMTDALERVPLSAEQREALLAHDGDQGRALGAVLAIECGDVDGIRFQDLAQPEIMRCYLSSVEWADHLTSGGGL